MEDTAYRAIAIVGVGAVLPDAPNVAAFWDNVKHGRYSISEVRPDRWDANYYYDPDPSAPDKSYSKIGGWVREYEWDPIKWRLPIPPRVAAAMDGAQQWAINCTRQVLEDYGYPKRPLDVDRTAVILGNAMAGEKHYLTALRVFFPEYAHDLEGSASFSALPEAVRHEITRELHERMSKHLPEVTEDSMPGELANCIAGRIANLFNFHGPNYVCDAACASAMAAMSSAVEGLVQNDFDAVLTGGIDRNMGAPTFVKFCKIGALSATGTRPFAEGADGFVMGEGAALFLLKRLADAERDGDKIYAVLRGIGGSSDGKGKGITAPNPLGQRLAVERAWQNAGISPATATYIEGHGTSTRVGDVVEVQSVAEVLGNFHLPVGSVALGSVKSNIGHLKGAAGAAGLLKTALALHHKVLPPSINCQKRNPDIDFEHSPIRVNTELRPWDVPPDGVRRAGASAFGFGGTNWHMVLEEHIPGRLKTNGKRTFAISQTAPEISPAVVAKGNGGGGPSYKAPLRGALVIGAASERELIERLRSIQKDAEAGRAPVFTTPLESDLKAPERVAIDYADAAELVSKSAMALKALAANQPAVWKALRAQGIFRGHGPAPKVAFLYTGQGSQYVNMLEALRKAEPIVDQTFVEADRVMTPLLGKPLSKYIYVDQSDPKAVAQAEDDLRQTEITQPAVLATDLALTRLLAAYGIRPDMTMGHSLGEYGALVASGALPFDEALEAVSARGRGMAEVAVGDKGKMAALFAPLPEIERLLKTVNGYVVIANINSDHQAVIGGATQAVEEAIQVFQKAGYEPVELPVSHAFHTSIVAPASEPLRKVLEKLHLESPHIPIVANLSGQFYPTGPKVVPEMVEILAQQVASPVQFVKGLHTLYEAEARIFIEVGPKKALQGFAEDVLGADPEVLSLFSNHPKLGDLVAFNQALCGLYASGLGRGRGAEKLEIKIESEAVMPQPMRPVESAMETRQPQPVAANGNNYEELGRMFADVLERGWCMTHGQRPVSNGLPVAITGAALGLPGTDHIFDDTNVGRILRGDQFIDVIPTRFRRAMLDKNITRLVKSDNGGPTFESINNVADVIKLAGRGGTFDLEKEFGVPADRMPALDRATQLAIGVGIDALRDAGIPLVMRYKTTSKGTQLPERWMLPEALRDDTGVVFASAFPGYNALIDELNRYYEDKKRREQLATLEDLRNRLASANGHSLLLNEIAMRISELKTAIEKEPYQFDRRFLFKTLSMGHSQFAEYIGARGPNTQVNSACASTTQAITVAEDWIRSGRCSRVVVISADDVTSDHMLEWIGAGFLATGAAATDEAVEDAAIPFDRRRHGMLIGMGAAAVIVESAEAARERGIQPICEVLATATANSAFHGTRLDVQHIGQVMEGLVAGAEAQRGIQRHQIAPHTIFMSHETYTPARGGSASAEIFALRRVFGDAADRIVIANTKGFTGHPMGTGIEDVVAIKALETGCVPPVANFKEVDPELGALNLSKGGAYPVEYALRLAAGFGSQISMSLLRWVRTKDGVRHSPSDLGYGYRIVDTPAWNAWLKRLTGYPEIELEVVSRTLRVRDKAAAARVNGNGTAAVQARPQVIKPEPAPAQQRQAGNPVVAPKPSVQVKPIAVESAAVQASTPPASSNPSVSDPVKERVLNLVAEKTGYPVDMLDLDLDLEADLGVDTVKQAEVFASIREAYGIQRDDSIKLREFPTLAHVIRFVHQRRPDLAMAANAKPQQAPQPVYPQLSEQPATVTTVDSPDPVKERILALVVEKTGYPPEMLDLDLDLEADLGVDTVKQAEMFAAIRETYNIPRDEDRKLRDYPTLAHVIRFVYEKRPDLKQQATATVNRTLPTLSVPAPVPVTVAPSAPTAADDPIKDKVLQIVAEKTGYPPEMLDLDLDLEADLGIDTVKQAEMFAAVRAAYNIPRDENLKLRDFPTLASVIKFAHDRAHIAAAPQPGAITQQPRQPIAATTTPATASFDAANNVPRRVPVPVLRPALELCKITGVTLAKKQRVLVMPDAGGVAKALAKRLTKSGVEVLTLDRTLDSEALTDCLKKWLAEGPTTGMYWLPALDHEGDLRDMDVSTWHSSLVVRLKSFYAAMRALYEQITTEGTFLVSATRLGGQHGYDSSGAVAPLGGAVVGFTKTYKRERPDVLVKAVDFTAAHKANEIADLLIEETLRDPGAVEIGYKDGLRWTVALEEQPVNNGQPGMALTKDTVFVITGAAGSIVSAITSDLASASGGTFYLLDLVPEPDANNPDLKRFTNDKEGLKRDLFARIQARGERATPALVEKELAGLERAQAAHAAIDAVRAAGGTPYYFSVNLTDSQAVAKVIEQVRERSGHIDLLLHAAGMERSHFLPDKDPREFNLIFDVKADGFFNLLHAIGDMPLGATVAFSSIAGRFGNAGQTDYSSANDLLCKITSGFRTTRPTTRGIVIDWTAWGGIGMATRGSIPKMMEVAGIDMLPPEAGIPWIRRELTEGSTRGEVVVAQRLGVLLNDWDVNGGIDMSKSDTRAKVEGPMIARLSRSNLNGTAVFETTLDPASQPFLHDHQIEGTPVLPGVMGIEGFTEAASVLVPGCHIESIEDVNFAAPFKFYRGEARTLRIEALSHPAENGVLVTCALIGERALPNQPVPQVTTHFTGRVRLTRNQPEPILLQKLGEPQGCVIEKRDIYPLYFHGPAYQVIQKAWWDGERVTGLFNDALPPNHQPSELGLRAVPRLIELCFQTAGLWEMGVLGRLGLPLHIDSVRVWPVASAIHPLYAVVTPDPKQQSFSAEVIDSTGSRYVHMTGYRTVSVPGAADTKLLHTLQSVMALEVQMV